MAMELKQRMGMEQHTRRSKAEPSKGVCDVRAAERIGAIQKIDYGAAADFGHEVRAFAIIESGEGENQLGDAGQSFGLLQMHPATFRRFYGSQMRFAPHPGDTWTQAQIKACASFLSVRGWHTATESERELIVQAWNLGEHAVYVEGRRNSEYLARWLAAYDDVKCAMKRSE
jgi:hypothetical protein